MEANTGAGAGPGGEGDLDDYDQMIFNQFMNEDESEMLAK